MASKKVLLERHFLAFIAHNTNYVQVEASLKKVDRQQYMALREIAVNIMKSTIELSGDTFQLFKDKREVIRKLANDRLSKAKLAQEAALVAEMVRLTLKHLF
jgi:hypothetical protein